MLGDNTEKISEEDSHLIQLEDDCFGFLLIDQHHSGYRGFNNQNFSSNMGSDVTGRSLGT